MEFADRRRRQPLGRDTQMFGGKIFHHECDVAVAVTRHVRFGPAVIDCQFQFKVAAVAQQIDEGEAVELEPVGNPHEESAPVEIDRPRLIQHADHAMDRFCHQC